MISRSTLVKDLEEDGVLHDARPSSLGDWYIEVREKRLGELSDGDFGIAIRQRIFVAEILPYVVERILECPFAGHKYDGELIVAISSLQDRQHYMDPTVVAALQRRVPEYYDDIGGEEAIIAESLLQRLVALHKDLP